MTLRQCWIKTVDQSTKLRSCFCKNQRCILKAIWIYTYTDKSIGERKSERTFMWVFYLLFPDLAEQWLQSIYSYKCSLTISYCIQLTNWTLYRLDVSIKNNCSLQRFGWFGSCAVFEHRKRPIRLPCLDSTYS